MSKIEKTEMKKLDVTNAYEVDCSKCDRSFIIDCGEEKEPMCCPYCGANLKKINNNEWKEIFTTFPTSAGRLTINNEAIPIDSMTITSNPSEVLTIGSRGNEVRMSNPRYDVDIVTSDSDWRL